MNDLNERLERIAATPAPATSVDAAAAIAKGRRIRRTRRAAAGAVAAGIAATVTAVAVLPGSPAEPQRIRPVQQQVKYPDLLVPQASFGWLPDGYARTRITRDDQERSKFSVDAGRGSAANGRTAVELTVYGAGPEPPVPNLPGGKKGHWTGTALINGRIGHWTVEPGGPGSDQVPAELRWEYEPDHWAVLSVLDPAIGRRETVLRIAEGVRFGTGSPAAFPLRVAGVPGGLKPLSVYLAKGPELWFQLGAKDGELGITVTPAGGHGTGRTNTKIDGHPAFDSRLPATGVKMQRDPSEAQLLRVHGVHGFDVQVQATGGPLRSLQATGGLTGLYHRLTLLGKDPARWTATPLG